MPLDAPTIVNDKLHPGRLLEVARCILATARGDSVGGGVQSIKETGEGKTEGREVSGASHSSGVPSVGE